MSNELIINSTQEVCRIALLKDKSLVEFHQDTDEVQFNVGDIYLAKRENGEWKFYSREDLEIPRDYIPLRDRVSQPQAAAQ